MSKSNSLQSGAIPLVWMLLLALFAGGGLVVADEPRAPQAGEGKIDRGGKYTPPDEKTEAGKAVPREQAEGALQDDVSLRRTGEHTFAIGAVILDEEARTITIPATVNMEKGLVEYALVEGSGKVHEALFATEATAEQVHVAALLLGMKPQRETARKDGGIDVPEACRIGVEVTWAKHGPAARHGLEELVLVRDPELELAGGENTDSLAGGLWFYNGSKFLGGRFLAGGEGSLIALIPDPAALVNNPRPSRMRDDGHMPNTKLLPPKGRGVHIVLRFPKPDTGQPENTKP